jgi:DNA-binding CsgD family transcriptional regulator
VSVTARSVASSQRRLGELSEVCAKATNDQQLFEDVSTRLREVVPFDGAAWFATDPTTILATSPVRIENVEEGHCESYWERECLVEDTLLYRDLARSPLGIASLYDATDGNPGRSARYREFLAPQGYGDELRAAFRLGESTWGVLDLYRDRARAAFSPAEIEMVRTIVPPVATALRSFATRPSPVTDGPHGPGTALFAANATLLSLDDQAERLFREVGGPEWAKAPLPMTPVYAVVARATAVMEGRERGPASARLRSSLGRWLSVHASCLRGPDGQPGPTALTIEPAKSAQIAPIIVEAYALTPREQEITRGVSRGLANQEIAADLNLSPHTVRDHLKAIFAKVGVASRGELVAKLFAEHYYPAIHAPGAYEHVEFSV